jgi:hypothetical protein
MSKHERQHSISHVADVRVSEVKRARVENMNITYSNHTDNNRFSTEKKPLK